ncbi:regulator [Streptomyces alboflavus]|uniref:Regulator n=1 Tax=Streptomyces alboflavus TaxID=67267 RepID=A0A1Z1WSE2_9ACTN|nr:regulator [Streptomyces alboflavus]
MWDSEPALPAVLPADPDRVGQHGLEIVMAVCQSLHVRREPVGKRITTAIALADGPGGTWPAAVCDHRPLATGYRLPATRHRQPPTPLSGYGSSMGSFTPSFVSTTRKDRTSSPMFLRSCRLVLPRLELKVERLSAYVRDLA